MKVSTTWKIIDLKQLTSCYLVRIAYHGEGVRSVKDDIAYLVVTQFIKSKSNQGTVDHVSTPKYGRLMQSVYFETSLGYSEFQSIG